jgi:nitrogen fixation protein FixH
MEHRMTIWTQSRWIPWAVVAGFAVIIAANSTLAYFAIHSDTGLVTAHPYELGNGYNRVIDLGAAQDRLGWQSAASLDNGSIVVKITDSDGRGLDGLAVTARIVRPLGPRSETLAADTVVPLVPAANGLYRAAYAFPQPGLWELRISAAQGSASYRFAQRIVVP